jgi:hypothetical protein
MPDNSNQWQIVPQGFFSRHYDLVRGGVTVASIKMSLWTEGCEFTIAGHGFAIRKVSIWKDGFQLFAGDQPVGNAKRDFWSRRFEVSSAGENWLLAPVGWFSRGYRFLAGEREVGTIQPTGWLTRKRVADFADEVPPPVQLFAIFLVLVVGQRQQKQASAGV